MQIIMRWKKFEKLGAENTDTYLLEKKDKVLENKDVWEFANEHFVTFKWKMKQNGCNSGVN